jgi:energy-coupling factor transporter ATP-binding protein EcfA2
LNGLLQPRPATCASTAPISDPAARAGRARGRLRLPEPDHQLFAATVADEVAFGRGTSASTATRSRPRRRDARRRRLARERDEDPFLCARASASGSRSRPCSRWRRAC